MNATVFADENVIRHIIQNVTEHLQDDEKDSFMLAYTLVALIVCLLLSIWISYRFDWFPSVAVYLVVGYFLQKQIVYSLSSQYNASVNDSHSQYTSLLTLCFLPLQMFQYGFSIDAPMFIHHFGLLSSLSVCSSLLFIFLFAFLFSNLSISLGLHPLTFWNTLAFSSAMCASDLTYVLPFFKRQKYSPRILSILEGETIVSEVISILLFRTIVELQINVMNGYLVLEGIHYFCSFLIYSISLGILPGILSSLVFKWMGSPSKGIDVLQVTLFFCVPILCYMLAEGCHVSSSIAVRICGFIMAYYTQQNLNAETFIHKMIDLMSYLSELCSFLVLGMISYNIQPFAVDWRWLVLCACVLAICHYASITGVLGTLCRKYQLLEHSQTPILYVVYRGAVSFILTARAEGELLENDQVMLMMRLSLSMIWLCIFQHVVIANPYSPIHLHDKEEKEEKKKEGKVKDVLYWFFVREIDE